MKLHSTHGYKQITQVDSEVSYTEGQEFSPHGLLQVAKSATSGSIQVKLVGDDTARTFDLAEYDVNSLNLLVTAVVSLTDVTTAQVRVFR